MRVENLQDLKEGRRKRRVRDYIKKSVHDDRTTTRVTPLKENDRVEELARIYNIGFKERLGISSVSLLF